MSPFVMERVKWMRANKRRPCMICEKPDWCTMTLDGAAACCMRIGSMKPLRNGGWLHRLHNEVLRILVQWEMQIRDVIESWMDSLPSRFPQIGTTLRAALREFYHQLCQTMVATTEEMLSAAPSAPAAGEGVPDARKAAAPKRRARDQAK